MESNENVQDESIIPSETTPSHDINIHLEPMQHTDEYAKPNQPLIEVTRNLQPTEIYTEYQVNIPPLPLSAQHADTTFMHSPNASTIQPTDTVGIRIRGTFNAQDVLVLSNNNNTSSESQNQRTTKAQLLIAPGPSIPGLEIVGKVLYAVELSIAFTLLIVFTFKSIFSILYRFVFPIFDSSSSSFAFTLFWAGLSTIVLLMYWLSAVLLAALVMLRDTFFNYIFWRRDYTALPNHAFTSESELVEAQLSSPLSNILQLLIHISLFFVPALTLSICALITTDYWYYVLVSSCVSAVVLILAAFIKYRTLDHFVCHQFYVLVESVIQRYGNTNKENMNVKLSFARKLKLLLIGTVYRRSEADFPKLSRVPAYGMGDHWWLTVYFRSSTRYIHDHDVYSGWYKVAFSVLFLCETLVYASISILAYWMVRNESVGVRIGYTLFIAIPIFLWWSWRAYCNINRFLLHEKRMNSTEADPVDSSKNHETHVEWESDDLGCGGKVSAWWVKLKQKKNYNASKISKTLVACQILLGLWLLSGMICAWVGGTWQFGLFYSILMVLAGEQYVYNVRHLHVLLVGDSIEEIQQILYGFHDDKRSSENDEQPNDVATHVQNDGDQDVEQFIGSVMDDEAKAIVGKMGKSKSRVWTTFELLQGHRYVDGIGLELHDDYENVSEEVHKQRVLRDVLSHDLYQALIGRKFVMIFSSIASFLGFIFLLGLGLGARQPTEIGASTTSSPIPPSPNPQETLYYNCQGPDPPSGDTYNLTLLDYAYFAKAAYSPIGNVQELLDTWFVEKNWRLERAPLSDDVREAFFYDFYNEQYNLTVLAIRGTVYWFDWVQDAEIWSEALILQAYLWIFPLGSVYESIFSTIVSIVHVAQTFSSPSIDSDAYRFYGASIVEYIREIEASRSEVVITGHSLGGGLSQLIGSALGKRIVAFSAPGILYTRGKYGLEIDEVRDKSFNIQPQRDIVPIVDVQPLARTRILCPLSLSLFECHGITNTICEITRLCGDPRGRIISEPRDGVLTEYTCPKPDNGLEFDTRR